MTDNLKDKIFLNVYVISMNIPFKLIINIKQNCILHRHRNRSVARWMRFSTF